MFSIYSSTKLNWHYFYYIFTLLFEVGDDNSRLFYLLTEIEKNQNKQTTKQQQQKADFIWPKLDNKERRICRRQKCGYFDLEKFCILKDGEEVLSLA